MSYVPGALGPEDGNPEDGNVDVPVALASRLYSELKSIARCHLMRERPGHTLQPTALVHEAYIRMANREESPVSREQFLALASITMRHVLIDYARRRRSLRRAGSQLTVTLDRSLKDELN